MAEEASKQLLASVKRVLTSGSFSDLTITCGSDTYKVHKVIVCERADFFARAIKFGGKEAQDRTIDLPEDEPAIIKLLIQYLYEGEYSPLLLVTGSAGTVRTTPAKAARPAFDPDRGHTYHYCFPHTCTSKGRYCDFSCICPHHRCSVNCNYTCQGFDCKECKPRPLPTLDGFSDQLLTHAKMYEIADKYDVDGLKELVKEKFSRSCQHFWDSSSFAIAAHHAFLTTPNHDKGIRGVVSATISEHIELVEKPEIQVLMNQFNGLALGILEEKIKEHGWGKKK